MKVFYKDLDIIIDVFEMEKLTRQIKFFGRVIGGNKDFLNMDFETPFLYKSQFKVLKNDLINGESAYLKNDF